MEGNRMEEIRKMLKAEPDDDFLNYVLALEYEKLGQHTEAIRMIEALLDRNAAYVGAYYKLGMLYELCGMRELAISSYKTGIEQARLSKNKKAYGELQEALQNLED
jgi:tetratricopeptide (TPR) repeat protein